MQSTKEEDPAFQETSFSGPLETYHGPPNLDPSQGFTGTNDPNTAFPIAASSGTIFSGAEWTCHLSGSEWIKKSMEGRLIFNLHTIVPRVHLQGISANRFFHSKDRLKPHEWATFPKFDKFMSCSSCKVGSVYTIWKEKVFSAILMQHLSETNETKVAGQEENQGYTGMDPAMVQFLEVNRVAQEDKNAEEHRQRQQEEEHRAVNQDMNGVRMGKDPNEQVVVVATSQDLEDHQHQQRALNMSVDEDHQRLVEPSSPSSSLEESEDSMKDEVDGLSRKRKRSKKMINEVKRNTAVKRSNMMVEKMKKMCADEQESFEDILDVYFQKNLTFFASRVHRFGKEASRKKVQRIYNTIKETLDQKPAYTGQEVMNGMLESSGQNPFLPNSNQM